MIVASLELLHLERRPASFSLGVRARGLYFLYLLKPDICTIYCVHI